MKHETILKQLDIALRESGSNVIIEIGTIRNTSKEHAIGDGHSTEHIARYLDQFVMDFDFFSVDLKIDIAKNYLKEKQLIQYVTLVESDGLQFLKAIIHCFDIAFIYLDGENDAAQTLKQFKVALSIIHKKGIILIDDCFPNSTEVVKCHDVINYLNNNNMNYSIENNMLIFKL